MACLPDRRYDGEHVLVGDLGDRHVTQPRVGETTERGAPAVRGPADDPPNATTTQSHRPAPTYTLTVQRGTWPMLVSFAPAIRYRSDRGGDRQCDARAPEFASHRGGSVCRALESSGVI